MAKGDAEYEVKRARLMQRVVAANFQQDTKAGCIICKKNFQDCPHSVADVYDVIDIVQTDILRRKYGL